MNRLDIIEILILMVVIVSGLTIVVNMKIITDLIFDYPIPMLSIFTSLFSFMLLFYISYYRVAKNEGTILSKDKNP